MATSVPGKVKNKASTKFPNTLAVTNYLQLCGWRVSKSTVYQHQKEGKLRPGPDGYFSLRAVEKYARMFLRRVNGRIPDDPSDELQQEKLQAEIQKMKAQAEHWELKAKIASSLYVPRERMENELAARAAIFRSDVENFIRSRAVDIVSWAGGDPEKVPDLIERLLAAAEDWLDRYASDERSFSIPVSPGIRLEEAISRDSEEEDEEQLEGD